MRLGRGVQNIRPINHVNIRDDVYNLVRRGILSHDYPPGYRFDLNDLSRRLQVSHTPVKEALHRLETEGLVHIYPRRGTFVTTLDARDIAESFGVRLALERYSAESIVRDVTDADVTRLRGILREMRKLLNVRDFAAMIETYIARDQDFHVEIVALGRNSRLVEIYKTVGGPLHMARILSQFSADSYRNHTEPEHDAILKAIDKRDPGALAKAMTEHVERAQRRILNGWDSRKPDGRTEAVTEPVRQAKT